MINGKETISNKQFVAMLVCCTWPTTINYCSGFLARAVGQDMWICGILSVLTALLFIPIIVYTGRKFPGKTIVEYSQTLLWTLPGKLLGLVLAAYFIVEASNCISMYIHHLTDFLLPETPFTVVTVMHAAIVCYLVWKGPEVIGRMGIIAFSLAAFFFLLVLLASLSEIDFNRLMPIFDSSALNMVKATSSADTFTGVSQIVVTMFLPLVSDQKKTLRSAAAGLSIGGSFFVFYFIVQLMVMGPQVVALMRIPSMDFVRSIQITQYLHRFESFMVALWYWSMLVQAGVLVYCSRKALIQTVGIKKEKTQKILVFAFGIIITILTYLIAYNRIAFLKYREFTWQYFALPIQYGIPLLLFIFVLIRKKAVNAASRS